MTRWHPAKRRIRYSALRQAGLCVECKRPSVYWACLVCRARKSTRRAVKEKANGPQ